MSNVRFLLICAAFSFWAWFFVAFFVSAQELGSTDFKVKESIIYPGEHSASAGYALHGVIGLTVAGNVSGGNFKIQSGFPALPIPSTPATPSAPPAPPATPSGGGGIPLSLLPQEAAARLIAPPSNLPQLEHRVNVCNAVDFYCDGKVDLKDLSAFLFLTAYSPVNNPADLNDDGQVDLADASILFTHWSSKTPMSLAMGVQALSLGKVTINPEDIFVFGTPSGAIVPRGIQKEQLGSSLSAISGQAKENALARFLRFLWEIILNLFSGPGTISVSSQSSVLQAKSIAGSAQPLLGGIKNLGAGYGDSLSQLSAGVMKIWRGLGVGVQ
jgi:hypothetical protein